MQPKQPLRLKYPEHEAKLFSVYNLCLVCFCIALAIALAIIYYNVQGPLPPIN